jgi:hypothetical protein
MFQGLTQGAAVTLFYRNDARIVTGKVVSVNTHMPTYNPNQPMAVFNGLVTDLNVQVGNDTIPFAGLPANGVVADFPSKGIYLAIDSSAAYKEVDTAIAALEQDLSSVPAKEQLLAGYKQLRQDSNPEAKREAEYKKEMAALRGELAEMRDLLLANLKRNNPEAE